MKIARLFFFCAAVLGVIPPLLAAGNPGVLNVMTFNIRYDNPADGPNAWSHRKDLVAQVFVENDVDVAGLQEVLVNQLADLEARLPGYGWIGVGRDDGKQAGEYAPIFYRKDKLELVKQGAFWLSETPDVPGKIGWDAACPRVATWGILRRKTDGQNLFFINTHFDHQGREARINGAKLLMEQIAALRSGCPVILTGDFNSEETDEAIKALIESKSYTLKLASRQSRDPERGAQATFNGFKAGDAGGVIDFVLVNFGISVTSYKYLPIVKDGVFVSDHWPVLARLRVPLLPR